MYPDHISVWNPGGLLPGMTLKDLTATPHASARRNPLIAQVAFIDHWVDVSRRTAANDLRRLVAAGVFLREGRTGRSTHYRLARSNGH
jgi:predicted HTH transcriptional regulator